MTDDKLEAMAREADPGFGNDEGDMPDAICGLAAIARFAELVRADERERKASHIERLARICPHLTVAEAAAAIRALPQA